MQYLAKWGQKGFLISSDKIVPLSGLKATFSLKNDANNDTSGTPSTNTQGRELVPVSFSTTYFAGAGVDVRAQIDEWNSLIGQIHPLYVGGKPFGAANLQLEKVDVSEIQTDAKGNFLWAKLAFSFVEKQPQAAAISTKKKTTKATDTKPVTTVEDARQAVLNAKPGTEEKKAAVKEYTAMQKANKMKDRM